jgi:copper chaperone
MVEKETLNVTGMSCGHCVKAVEQSVGKLEGITSVSVDLESSSVEVNFESDKVNIKQIKDAIEDQGYDVQA